MHFSNAGRFIGRLPCRVRVLCEVRNECLAQGQVQSVVTGGRGKKWSACECFTAEISQSAVRLIRSRGIMGKRICIRNSRVILLKCETRDCNLLQSFLSAYKLWDATAQGGFQILLWGDSTRKINNKRLACWWEGQFHLDTRLFFTSEVERLFIKFSTC